MVGPEYTTIHIKATTVGGPNYNVFDVYRTQGSCIIEHWDCLEPATTDNTTVSPHPYF
jgi:predicted SnoaL-like aldol condensation-catalyzing enzyme